MSTNRHRRLGLPKGKKGHRNTSLRRQRRRIRAESWKEPRFAKWDTARADQYKRNKTGTYSKAWRDEVAARARA